MRVITDPVRVAYLYEQLLGRIANEFSEAVPCHVLFRGGRRHTEVHYSPRLDLYVDKQLLENRFWLGANCGHPIRNGVNHLTVEMNVPRNGLNPLIAAAFGEDESGEVFLLHRGKIGGGKIGVGPRLFHSHFQGELRHDVMEGGNPTTFAVIATLNSETLFDEMRAFVLEVRRIKQLVNN